MADKRKAILLRIPKDLADTLNRWAEDELRSLNAQIEFLLREAVRRGGRGREKGPAEAPDDAPGN